MMRYVLAAIIGAAAGHAWAKSGEDDKGAYEDGYKSGYDEAWAEVEAAFREAVNNAPDKERICRAALAYALTREKTGELPTAIRRELDEWLNPEGDTYLAHMFDQLARREDLDVTMALKEFEGHFGAEQARHAREVIESRLDLIRAAGREVSPAAPPAIIFRFPA